jgi:enamine deaminase RidA (YjgF/YER057c/UK114 family)
VPLTHINPDSLHRNPAFSQGVLVEGPGALLVVGGQNGVNASGSVVSADVGEQTAQALRNLLAVLAEVGAGPSDVAKLTIYLVAGTDLGAAFAASRDVWGAHATAVTGMFVAALANPAYLVEIEALALVPATS